MILALHCAGCDEPIPTGASISFRDSYFCRQCGLYQAALSVGPLLDARWTVTPGTEREREDAVEVMRFLLKFVEARLRQMRAELGVERLG